MLPRQSEIIDILTSEENDPDNTIRKGKVIGLFSNGEPKIQFSGEDEPRNKIYSRLSANVKVGDTVFLIKAFGSWLYWKDYTTSYKVE